MTSHSDLMRDVYMTGRMSSVVAAGGGPGLMNLGLEEHPGEAVSSRMKQRAMVLKVLSLLTPPKGSLVGDVGCGKGGAISLLLKRYPDVRAVGFNIDQNQLEQASRLLKTELLGERCEFHAVDLESTYEFTHVLNAAYSIELLTHIRNKAKFFSNVWALLVPGARVVFAYTTLARDWENFCYDDQEYMLKIGSYFKEEPRNFLTQRVYNGFFEAAGFIIEQHVDLTDKVFPHRHYEMARVYRAITSKSLSRRIWTRFYWNHVEGCDLEQLELYLGDAIRKNQGRLYEYHLTVLKKNC